MKLEPQAAAGQPIEPNAQSSFLLLYYGSSLHCLYLMLPSEEQSIEQYVSNHVHVHVRMCSPALRVWGYLILILQRTRIHLVHACKCTSILCLKVEGLILSFRI